MSGNVELKTPGSKEQEEILKQSWAIRPCVIYKDEYDNCTSIKARFHQYFVHGENTDCTSWNTDYENCIRYKTSDGTDIDAAVSIIESERQRREDRLKAHYANTTWKKRTSPPEDWSRPLPESFAKRNENTYLELKQLEIDGKIEKQPDTNSYCSLM